MSVYASRLSRKKRRAIFEGLVDLEIGVQSNMGPEIRLQRLFEDRFVGVVRKGHPLAKQAEIGVGDYVAWGHVVASPDGALHGSVDDALAELGTKRKLRASYRDFRQPCPWRWNRILSP